MTPTGSRYLTALALLPLAFVAQPATAQDGPIAAILRDGGEDLRTFEEHIVTLSNPFFEGRIPGSRGMEIAKDYFEWYLERAGIEPGFADSKSFRQPFPLRERMVISKQELSIGDTDAKAETDFNVLGLSAPGMARGEAVFVGYGIEKFRGYTSFPSNEKLDGKIAVIFRFEPMSEKGQSQWANLKRAPWTRNGGFRKKILAVQKRGAVAAVFVNPPGCADPRALTLVEKGGGGTPGGGVTIPVAMVSNQAAGDLLGDLYGMETRAACDEGTFAPKPLGKKLWVTANIEKKAQMAENVGGMLRGRGALADQWILIGAHLDHLGIGRYGARNRNRIGEIHPGADDNASGSAAVLMLAASLRKAYDKLPKDQPLRSILFVGFDAEEAGLNGSYHYVANPITDLENHSLMINFDMIGRITKKRLSVSGVGTAGGMSKWLQPIFEDSGLEIVQNEGSGIAGSDHWPFYQKQVPILFGIIADFHDDYHTPADVSWKINRVDSVKAIHMFHAIALKAAQVEGSFTFQR